MWDWGGQGQGGMCVFWWVGGRGGVSNATAMMLLLMARGRNAACTPLQGAIKADGAGGLRGTQSNRVQREQPESGQVPLDCHTCYLLSAEKQRANHLYGSPVFLLRKQRFRFPCSLCLATSQASCLRGPEPGHSTQM